MNLRTPCRSFLFGLIAIVALCPATSGAQATATFSDIPNSNALAPAVEYLQSQKIMQGFADGTFRPGQKVTKAEAVKIIVSSLGVSSGQLDALSSRSFKDVPSDAWYAAYVEWAFKRLGILEGPPKRTDFKGASVVKKAEFLKMLLTAKKYDPKAFNDIQLPLSDDVKDTKAWYYPYLRLSMTTSMTMATAEHLLSPDRELTRGDVALFLYRLAMYESKKRTQALLSEAESELSLTMSMIDAKKLTQAEYASARALLAARGAHAKLPDPAIVKSALKISESFRALVRAYRAGSDGKFDDAVRISKDAWTLAEEAKKLSPDLTSLSNRVETYAKTIADQARTLKKK